jgi:predicted MFS family arabinose efflux permease
MMRRNYVPNPGTRPRTLAGAQELLSFIYRRQPALGWVTIIMACNSVFALSYAALMPLIARDILGTGPQGYGFLMGATGLGAFLGALVLATYIRRYPPMYFFWGGSYLMLAALFVFSCTRSYHFAMGCLFVAGFGMTITVSTGNSLVQLNVPDTMRGRVMSLFSLTFLGFTPLGNFMYGSLAHYIGPCATVRLGTGMAAILGLVFFLTRPGLRSLNFTPDA